MSSLVSLHKDRQSSCVTPNVKRLHKNPLYFQWMSKQKYHKFYNGKNGVKPTASHILDTLQEPSLQQILLPDWKHQTTVQCKTWFLTLTGKELSDKKWTTVLQFLYYRANYCLIQISKVESTNVLKSVWKCLLLILGVWTDKLIIYMRKVKQRNNGGTDFSQILARKLGL